jgi:hypothetical protein
VSGAAGPVRLKELPSVADDFFANCIRQLGERTMGVIVGHAAVWPRTFARLADVRPRGLRATGALLAVVAVGLLFSWSHWSAPVQWTPDSLFYEAQAHEIAGASATDARNSVFHGPLERSVDDGTGRFTDPRWITVSSGFFRRRWVVPAATAALTPVFGGRSLELVSLVGYLLAGALTFVLLRRRFGIAAAATAALALLWFPELRTWSFYPLSDSVGVAALTASLLAASSALACGSRRSIVLWTASVALLAFTKDAATIIVAAACLFFLFERSRRSAVVAAAGVLAALPAPLLFGTPLRTTMAFTFSGNEVPTNDTWSFVLGGYRTFVGEMLHIDYPVLANWSTVTLLVGALALLALPATSSERMTRVRRIAIRSAVLIAVAYEFFWNQLQTFRQPLAPGVALLICLLPLLAPAKRDDILVRFARVGALAAVAYLFLLPQFTDLRLGLVLMPFAAVGFARAISWWQLSRRVPHVA